MKTRYMQWRSRFFTKPTATSPRLQKYIDSNRLRTLLLGAFGSILITLSSYGVGWIADSSGFWRNNLIRTIRYEVSWVIVCIIALSLGAMIMCREWLRIYQKMGTWNNSSLRWMIAIVTCWSLPQVFALTIYSRDMFSYYGQGMVMAHGLNPYKQGVSEIANFMQNGADPQWAESPPPYGPISLKIEEFIARIVDGNIDLAIFLFRLVSVLAVIGILFFVVKLAQLYKYNQTRALWQVGANPLFIASFIASGPALSWLILLSYAGLPQPPHSYAHFRPEFQSSILGWQARHAGLTQQQTPGARDKQAGTLSAPTASWHKILPPPSQWEVPYSSPGAFAHNSGSAKTVLKVHPSKLMPAVSVLTLPSAPAHSHAL